jgi:hypothetical protein
MAEPIVHAQRPLYEGCQVIIPLQEPKCSSRRAPRQIPKILLALRAAGLSNGHFNGQRFIVQEWPAGKPELTPCAIALPDYI